MSFNVNSGDLFSGPIPEAQQAGGFSNGAMPNDFLEMDDEIDPADLLAFSQQMGPPTTADGQCDGTIQNGGEEMGFGGPVAFPTSGGPSQSNPANVESVGVQYDWTNSDSGAEMGLSHPTGFPMAGAPSQQMLPNNAAFGGPYGGTNSNSGAGMNRGFPMNFLTALPPSQQTLPDTAAFDGPYGGANLNFGAENGTQVPNTLPVAGATSQQAPANNAACGVPYDGTNFDVVLGNTAQDLSTPPAVNPDSQGPALDWAGHGAEYTGGNLSNSLERMPQGQLPLPPFGEFSQSTVAAARPLDRQCPTLSPDMGMEMAHAGQGSSSAPSRSSPVRQPGMLPVQPPPAAAAEPVPTENTALPSLQAHQLPLGNGTYRPKRTLGPRKKKQPKPAREQGSVSASSSPTGSVVAPTAASPQANEPRRTQQDVPQGNKVGQIPGLAQANRIHERFCNPYNGCGEECPFKKGFPERWHRKSLKKSLKRKANLNLPEKLQTELWEKWAPAKPVDGYANDLAGNVMPAAEPPRAGRINRTRTG